MVGPRPTGRGRRRGRRAAAARGAAGRHRAGQGLQLRAAVAGRGHLGRRVGSGGDVVRNVLVAALASLMVSLLGTPFAIRLFRARGYGQLIRDDGPTTHQTKRGTPTMGGTVIIFATLLGYVGAHIVPLRGFTASGLLVIGLMTGLGAVGFLDDFIKIRKQRSLGLTATAKFGGQAIVAVVFGILATHFVNGHKLAPASTHLSFVRDYGLDFGAVAFVVWAYFMIAATSNGVNLTDGLDGLASGASCMVFGAYVIIAFWEFGNNCANLAPVTNC